MKKQKSSSSTAKVRESFPPDYFARPETYPQTLRRRQQESRALTCSTLSESHRISLEIELLSDLAKSVLRLCTLTEDLIKRRDALK